MIPKIICLTTINLKSMSYKLSQFYNNESVVDIEFNATSFPNKSLKKSIAYCSDIKFCNLINNDKNIIGIITNENLIDKFNKPGSVVCDNPAKLFFEIHNNIYKDIPQVKKKTKIGSNCSIHPSALIEDNVVIGNNVYIGENVVIKAKTIIEDNVLIDSNAVIGCTGHFYKYFDGTIFDVFHAGGVKIGGGSKILSGSRIAKSVFNDYTEIGPQNVISINVNIGHSTILGRNVIIAGSAQVSGFCNIGSDVWIGPGAVISDSLNIDCGARIEIGSVVVKDISKLEHLSGPFAINHRINMRNFVKNNH